MEAVPSPAEKQLAIGCRSSHFVSVAPVREEWSCCVVSFPNVFFAFNFFK
jgi:hypothetical protein